MGWDRKRRGAGTGYFYLSKRVPGVPHPVKVYVGRGQAGHEAAAELDRRRRDRLEAKALLRADRDGAGEADRLAAELRACAGGLLALWMGLTGHHKRRGQWRGVGRG